MLISAELIDRLAETLEGIVVSDVHQPAPGQGREATVLVYHSSGIDVGGPVAGESPILEINLSESDGRASVVVTSALGIAEMHDVEEVRLLGATEEAAFYSRIASNRAAGAVSLLTVSSRGALQVYMNISESLAKMELTDVKNEDLRAAVALKIFVEQTEIFFKEE